MRTDRRLTAGIGRAVPSHTCSLRTNVIPRFLTVRQKWTKQSGIVAGSWSLVHNNPHTVPEPTHPAPNRPSEANWHGNTHKGQVKRPSRPCRFDATDFKYIYLDTRRQFDTPFPPRTPRCRIMHVDSRKPGRVCSSRFSGLKSPCGVSGQAQDPKPRRGQSRLDHRPGLLSCGKSPRVCGAKPEPARASGGEQGVVTLPPSPQPRPCVPFCHVDRPCP